VQKYYNLSSKELFPSTYSLMQPTITPKKIMVLTPPKKTTMSTTPFLNMDFNVTVDMNKTKANVSIYDIHSITQLLLFW
jgi:hypothetical protein